MFKTPHFLLALLLIALGPLTACDQRDAPTTSAPAAAPSPATPPASAARRGTFGGGGQTPAPSSTASAARWTPRVATCRC